jgi:hypothetical protein
VSAEDAGLCRRTAAGRLWSQSQHPRASKQHPCTKGNSHTIPCYASHLIPSSYFVCQRVKELDQALLVADEQYTALKCSLVDRKAVLSVEDLQQVQASIYCTAANEWLIDTCVAAQSLSPAASPFLPSSGGAGAGTGSATAELGATASSGCGGVAALHRRGAAPLYLSTYLPTYLTSYIVLVYVCCYCCSWSKASRQCQGKCATTTSSKGW